jgi:molybdopterin molybdotransferase
VRLKGFEKLTSIDDAMNRFFESLKLEPKGAVEVPLELGLGRVLAEEVLAASDLPSFNRSAVDGYAVRAEDTFEASQFAPKQLKLTSGDRIREKQARPTWTGNMLPSGADAVIMLEYTRKKQGRIEVLASVTPGENVSKRGEDVRKSEVAVEAGTRLRPQHLGLLGALGLTKVMVRQKPSVVVLSTGNELVKLGEKPKLGQIIGVNRLILSNMCRELGGEPIDLGIVKDDIAKISAKIQEAIKGGDLVLTTGGTSVGHADLVPAAVNRIGKPGIIVHGVAMRPGMPTALAVLEGKPILVLSGNPVASMIGFEVFARPLILKLLGMKDEPRVRVKAKLTRKVASALGRRVFLRVHIYEENGEFFAEPVRIKGSGVLSTMTRANGYVVISENIEGIKEGEVVSVHVFNGVERSRLV